jgi:hypothetical protein
MNTLAKYILEGLAISVVFYLMTGAPVHYLIGLTILAAVTFYLLDRYSPKVGEATRIGTGFSLGLQLVGGGGEEEVQEKSQQTTKVDEDKSQNFKEETNCSFGTLDTLNLKPEILREINTDPVPNQTGACDMKPYTNQAKVAEDYARVLESQSIKTEEMVPTDTSCYSEPYKVIPGVWSEEALIAGYNENVRAANSKTAYWSGF